MSGPSDVALVRRHHANAGWPGGSLLRQSRTAVLKSIHVKEIWKQTPGPQRVPSVIGNVLLISNWSSILYCIVESIQLTSFVSVRDRVCLPFDINIVQVTQENKCFKSLPSCVSLCIVMSSNQISSPFIIYWILHLCINDRARLDLYASIFASTQEEGCIC